MDIFVLHLIMYIYIYHLIDKYPWYITECIDGHPPKKHHVDPAASSRLRNYSEIIDQIPVRQVSLCSFLETPCPHIVFHDTLNGRSPRNKHAPLSRVEPQTRDLGRATKALGWVDYSACKKSADSHPVMFVWICCKLVCITASTASTRMICFCVFLWVA